MVGDIVEVMPTEEGKGCITDIHPRKNCLTRPPIANIDTLALVASCSDPPPNLLVLDLMTVVAQRSGVKTVLIFTKTDLCPPDEFVKTYETAGFEVCAVSNISGEGAEKVRTLLASGVTAFCGNTGVGKSSLLNMLYPHLELPTGDISRKLGRGRHTTRFTCLYDTGTGGYIADTPGFTTAELKRLGLMTAESLADCFIDFHSFDGKCRYNGCTHRSEKGCAIIEAVHEGKIAPSRHSSYLALYEELKDVREWEINKK